MKQKPLSELPAIKVRQWLADWDEVQWSENENRAEPEHWFYLFSISAADLKALSGIYARSTEGRKRGKDDLGIQRRHEEKRSEEITEFVKNGFPWSGLSKAKRDSGRFDDLKKPGWLPTAIVVNIITKKDKRRVQSIDRSDIVTIENDQDTIATLKLPNSFSGPKWKYKTIPPIEVIDGQHRLWAFEEMMSRGDFELPVVAFVGLDLSWQAYLFYTINIKPKKINASLAYDLYPLLRTEDWLERAEGHVVYRETRAQEIVDLLWSHPKSPWHHRINMLGESGIRGNMISQAAWIRALLASFVKSWEGRSVRIGGLFGGVVGSASDHSVLPWNRPEQAAFIIVAGDCLRISIESAEHSWIGALRNESEGNLNDNSDDPAFFGPHTLLSQDQGIRVFLQIINDLCFVTADEIKLIEWGGGKDSDGLDEDSINEAIKSLKQKKRLFVFLKDIAKSISAYDWRSSSAPSLSKNQELEKSAFRGSGGYKLLREAVLVHIAHNRGEIGLAANKVLTALGYSE